MGTFMEGRRSESPHIDMVWRGQAGKDYAPVCPADIRWNLLFLRYQGAVRTSIEGPVTQSVPKHQPEGMEFLVIKFALGTFLRTFTPDLLVNGDAVLPVGSRQSFWLDSETWQYPTFDNAETFVERLVHSGILVHDPLVKAAIAQHPQDVSTRTVRRRFLRATGLTQGSVAQIERVHLAASLLNQGNSILDVVDQAGYADQPHLTRSLKRYYGQTPAQLVRDVRIE